MEVDHYKGDLYFVFSTFLDFHILYFVQTRVFVFCIDSGDGRHISFFQVMSVLRAPRSSFLWEKAWVISYTGEICLNSPASNLQALYKLISL